MKRSIIYNSLLCFSIGDLLGNGNGFFVSNFGENMFVKDETNRRKIKNLSGWSNSLVLLFISLGGYHKFDRSCHLSDNSKLLYNNIAGIMEKYEKSYDEIINEIIKNMIIGIEYEKKKNQIKK